jgi:hypothetical protein
MENDKNEKLERFKQTMKLLRECQEQNPNGMRLDIDAIENHYEEKFKQKDEKQT